MARTALPALSADAADWLAQTFARNQRLYGGWSMEGTDDPPADPPKKDDPPADPPKKDDLGYPADTPVAEMTAEQQAAYHRHQSRKHEGRSKEWSGAFPGKTPAEIKAIVDAAEEARRNALTVDEKALEDARNEGRSALLAELGPAAVRGAFDLLLPADMPQKEKDEHLDVLDLKKFLTDDNQVDTAKVRAAVARISPDKGQQGGQRRDYGAGSRSGGGPAAGSVAAVMAERRSAREQKTTTS